MWHCKIVPSDAVYTLVLVEANGAHYCVTCVPIVNELMLLISGVIRLCPLLKGFFLNDFSFLLVLTMVIKTQHSYYLYRFLASLVLGFVRLLLLISLIGLAINT